MVRAARQDYLPTLRMYLDELLKDQNLPLERHEKKELNRFFKSTDTWFHLDSLDSMVHNLAGAPSESDLRTDLRADSIRCFASS